MNDHATLALSQSLNRLSEALENLVPMVEVLVEAMPAKTEASILGLSENTVRKNRKKRRERRDMLRQ